jgi:ketosteroid isomerase-like protein
MGADLQSGEGAEITFLADGTRTRGDLMSREIADSFIEALHELEENRDDEALVEIHTEDCEVGNVSVSETFRGHDGLREFWSEYRKTFGEMKSTFRNVFATEDGAALEWTTEGTSNGETVAYDGVSILEVEGGKVRRFMAYFDSRRLTPQVVD